MNGWKKSKVMWVGMNSISSQSARYVWRGGRESKSVRWESEQIRAREKKQHEQKGPSRAVSIESQSTEWGTRRAAHGFDEGKRNFLKTFLVCARGRERLRKKTPSLRARENEEKAHAREGRNSLAARQHCGSVARRRYREEGGEKKERGRDVTAREKPFCATCHVASAAAPTKARRRHYGCARSLSCVLLVNISS